eukprot:COSAG02_NODE_26541_length_630_cov_2.632768_1_plen_125_part_01
MLKRGSEPVRGGKNSALFSGIVLPASAGVQNLFGGEKILKFCIFQWIVQGLSCLQAPGFKFCCAHPVAVGELSHVARAVHACTMAEVLLDTLGGIFGADADAAAAAAAAYSGPDLRVAASAGVED